MRKRRGNKTDMKEIIILHSADLHLDSPFEGLGADKAKLRRKEQRGLLKKMAQLAQARQVDMILLAGDLLDSSSAYAETAEEISGVFGALDIPVFIAPGNHDFYSPSSPYAKAAFPENIHIFKSSVPECVPLPELGVRVWGAAFTDRYSAGMLRGFAVCKEAGVRDIMCIHGETDVPSQYDPISSEDIAASGMDYIALGHIHRESGLKKAGGTYYAWPGCPEGRGFDETGEKYVYIVTLGDGCTVSKESVAARRYEVLPVELEGGDVLTEIAAALPENTENDVYRIILRGETEEAPRIGELATALGERFFSLQLRDETVLRRDVWESAGEDSLRGQFLIRLKSAYDAAQSEAEKEKIMQAARWGLAALDNREEVVQHGNT